MCMRPTHVSAIPETQLVGVNGSHDNDLLPEVDEIVHTIITCGDGTDVIYVEDKTLLYDYEKAYMFEDEKDEKKYFYYDDEKNEDSDWFLPKYERVESGEFAESEDSQVNTRRLSRGKTIAKAAAGVYILLGAVALYAMYNGESCM